MECIICHIEGHKRNMISPCNCSGTINWVHPWCLQEWINYNQSTVCPTCLAEYVVAPDSNLSPPHVHRLQQQDPREVHVFYEYEINYVTSPYRSCALLSSVFKVFMLLGLLNHPQRVDATTDYLFLGLFFDFLLYRLEPIMPALPVYLDLWLEPLVLMVSNTWLWKQCYVT